MLTCPAPPIKPLWPTYRLIVRLVAEWAASNGYPGFTWRIALELPLVMDERLMAASYFERAFACFQQQNHQAGQQLLHANLALVHAELGDSQRADHHSQQASGRAYPADGEVWGRIGA